MLLSCCCNRDSITSIHWPELRKHFVCVPSFCADKNNFRPKEQPGRNIFRCGGRRDRCTSSSCWSPCRRRRHPVELYRLGIEPMPRCKNNLWMATRPCGQQSDVLSSDNWRTSLVDLSLKFEFNKLICKSKKFYVFCSPLTNYAHMFTVRW